MALVTDAGVVEGEGLLFEETLGVAGVARVVRRDLLGVEGEAMGISISGSSSLLMIRVEEGGKEEDAELGVPSSCVPSLFKPFLFNMEIRYASLATERLSISARA